jgi:4-hydroxybenzoate polyprenyltransferase
MVDDLRHLLKISRPRFWMYTAGPYILGTFASAPGYKTFISLRFWIYLLVFVIAANVLIYGVNDLADADTDKHNEKKGSYEVRLEKQQRAVTVIACGIAFGTLVVSVIGQSMLTAVLMGVFLMLSIGYSVPPLRFKARPLFDSVSNVLYAMPGFITASIWATDSTIPMTVIVASWLWCMAMHTFSAVPDVTADLKAGLATTATWLGVRGALVYCGLCWLFSAILLGMTFRNAMYGIVWSCALAVAYLGMTVSCLVRGASEKTVFQHYRIFPFINAAAGFGTTMIVLIMRWPQLHP